uniref:Uncharacterized protein n=1 Tax=Pyrodinium bahamense TaxID=73915 RepID=A0A7S0BBJ8_9DINO
MAAGFKGRADSAAVVVEVVEAFAASLSPANLAALAGACGLPVGEDEEVDARAAVARARGDLFFEDVGGAVPVPTELEEERQGADAAADPTAVAEGRTLGELGGVEELRPSGRAGRPAGAPAKRRRHAQRKEDS